MAVDPRVRPIAGIETEPLFDIVVDLLPRLDFGTGPAGRRILFGASGGTFHGPRISGVVESGGGDWAVFRADGVMHLDVRLTLRTNDDALVYLTYGGRWVVPRELRRDIADPARARQVDPARYYFRTNPLFETSAAEYAWLNDVVCVGSGYPVDGGIAYRIWQIM